MSRTAPERTCGTAPSLDGNPQRNRSRPARARMRVPRASSPPTCSSPGARPVRPPAPARVSSAPLAARSGSGAAALAVPVWKSKRGPWAASYCGDCRSSDRALVSPPVALTLDVFARILTEIGRADHDDLEPLRPGLVASPRTGRDADRVPLLELDDLVVELHPSAPAQDHVHL